MDGPAAGTALWPAYAAALGVAAFVWWSREDRVFGLWPALLAGSVVAWGWAWPGAGERALAFSGEPLLAFAFAALALAASRLRPARWWLPLAIAPLYIAAASNARSAVGPNGDEPQYLMVAESLLRDADLTLDIDFAEERYRAFHPEKLDPHFRIRGREGEIYSLHAIGLSVLILPGYAIAGYAGASTFMALLGVVLALEIRRLVRSLAGDETIAEGVSWVAALSPPVIHYAGLIFTEIPAALLLATGLRHAAFGSSRASLAWAALCASALPWFNVRYGILSIAIAVATGARLKASPSWRGDVLRPVLIAAASFAALLLFHFTLWGFWDPRRVYGRQREFALDVVPTGLPGLFFDQEFGLLPYAPVYGLAIAGGAALWRRNRALALGGCVAVAGVIAVASAWPMWRGGFNPPARFLVPLVPLLTASLGALFTKVRFGAVAALLCGWSLWTGLAGAADIATVHRDRSGSAPFFRAHSGAEEWTTLLPSFVLDEDRATRSLGWPWAALLVFGGAAALWRRRTNAASFSAASFALIATATLAGSMSAVRRPAERDAARLLGPSFFRAPVEARWRPADDAVYEPHRFPDGWVFARHLKLASGRYELRVLVEGTGDPPEYAVLDSRQRIVSSHGLRGDATGRVRTAGEFGGIVAVPRDGEWFLAFRGGAPLRLLEASLRPVD